MKWLRRKATKPEPVQYMTVTPDGVMPMTIYADGTDIEGLDLKVRGQIRLELGATFWCEIVAIKRLPGKRKVES